MKKNIAVIFGGKSAEHDISIITAIQTIKELNKEKYNVFPIYISKQNKWFFDPLFCDITTFKTCDEKKYKSVVFEPSTKNLLIEKRRKYKHFKSIDCAVVCCHGMFGEDGCLQGYLELSGVPYTSPNQISSGICMDKILMKKIFESNGFSTTNFVWFNRFEYHIDENKILEKIENKIGYPVVVKPASLGSSIGISFCKNREELMSACEVAMCYDNRIIVEKGLENFREINCSVIGNSFHQETSVLEEPKLNNNILNFVDKYISKDNFKRIIDVKLPKKIENKIKGMSNEIFKEFVCKGVIRIDFMLEEKTQKIYVNEVNTIPGSLCFYLWKNKTYKQLLDEIISCAIEEFEEKEKNIYSFKSDAIINFSSGNKFGKGVKNSFHK